MQNAQICLRFLNEWNSANIKAIKQQNGSISTIIKLPVIFTTRTNLHLTTRDLKKYKNTLVSDKEIFAIYFYQMTALYAIEFSIQRMG